MTRLISAVISGTVFLNGDDLTRAPGQQLARTYLTNARLNAVARRGLTFQPVEGDTGTAPASVFVLHDGARHYLAVFNFGDAATTTTVDLARAGLDPTADYQTQDLWTGAAATARGRLPLTLTARFAKLLALQVTSRCRPPGPGSPQKRAVSPRSANALTADTAKTRPRLSSTKLGW